MHTGIIMKKFTKNLTLFLSVIIVSWIATEEAQAQADVALDINSRYVWRGFDFGNSPSIQPEVTYAFGGLEVGVWGAYATTGNPDGTEIDWFASYGIEAGQGEIALSITDYTFPDGTTDYFSSDAHHIELGAGYSGPLSGQVGFYVDAGIFVLNDDDNSIYNEWGLTFGDDDLFATLFAGFTPGESAEYGTTGFAFINTGTTVSKSVDITEQFSINLTTSLVANPNSKNMFMVFGIGL